MQYTTSAVIASVGGLANGAWWLTKRAIWGKQLTPEEKILLQQQQILQQQQYILQILDKQPTGEEQHNALIAIAQHSDVLNTLKSNVNEIEVNKQ